MQALAQFWRHMTTRPVRQAFGLAPLGQAWALVALTRQGADLARVQASSVVDSMANWSAGDRFSALAMITT